MHLLKSTDKSFNVSISFAQIGPYHWARIRALNKALRDAGHHLYPMQISASSITYAWKHESYDDLSLYTIQSAPAEVCNPLRIFFSTLYFLRTNNIRLAFLPSYSPLSSFAMFLAARVLRCKTVLMCASHGGTAKASGYKLQFKKSIVQGFDAAIVGGTPHRNYFSSLGLPIDRIFTGYDAVDNHYFSSAASAARSKRAELKDQLKLPERYVLSLGRLVEKKNLAILIESYAKAAKKLGDSGPALVIVGSGNAEPHLKRFATELGLRVCEGETLGENQASSVHFHGFRHINENAIYYALADFFVLPSYEEEWGLVVNEAMACGLPVLVSKSAGCAADLVSENVNGHCFQADDSDALASLICGLHGDPSLRESMGSESVRMIAKWGCENFAEKCVLAMNAALQQNR